MISAPRNLPTTKVRPLSLKISVFVSRVYVPRQRLDKEKAKRDTKNYGEAVPEEVAETALEGSDVSNAVS